MGHGGEGLRLDLTSDCVMEKLSDIAQLDRWRPPRRDRPRRQQPPDCGLVLKLDGTEYVQYYPEEAGTYDCSPDYVVKVTGRGRRPGQPRRQPDLPARLITGFTTSR